MYKDGDEEDLHLFMELYHLSEEDQPKDPTEHISSKAGMAAASPPGKLSAEKPSDSRMTSPQMSYPSPTSRTKMRDLSEVSQDDYSAKRAAAMLARRSTSVSQQPRTAGRKRGNSAVTSAADTADQQREGSSRDCIGASQQADPGSETGRPSAAAPQQANTCSRNDVISLMSSVESSSAEELSGDDEDDDEVTMMSHSNGGSPAVGASGQPPAASSAPAVKHELVSALGDADITLDSSDDEDAPRGHSPAAGRAASSAQPSSAARASSGLSSEKEAPQEAEHLQVLLNAPGIRPAAMCLFRQGDMDWLSCFQLHKQLLSNISSSTLSQRASKEPDSKRLAVATERAFLVATGVFRRDTGNAVLVTVEAACNLLWHYGASATTVAAVQGLQGSKPMTPAELSSLPSLIARLSAENCKTALEESSGDEEGDDEITMVSRSSSGSPAANASTQPPAATSAPAVMVNPDSSDEEEEPQGQSPPAGRAASFVQPSSKAAGSKGLPQEKRSSQAEHLQVLLEAPGIRPTAVCLIRDGDVDWLSFPQFHRVLLSNVNRRTLWDRLRSPNGVGPGSITQASRKETKFLAAKGACKGHTSGLLTVPAACNLLQRSGASASTIAAMQGLQGAKAMTPAHISSLPPPSARHSGDMGKSAIEEPSGDEESDDEVSLISQSSGGSLAAGARMQPPAASSAPAVKHVPVPNSGDVSLPLKSSDDEDAPPGQSPAAGSKSLPEQRSSQAEHLQVLLKAPGIRPTAMCLIRDGDLDWLSFPQFHSVLLSDFAATSLHSRLRSPKGAGPGSYTRATRKEYDFLKAKAACRGPRPGLVTVAAVCNLLQRCGAPASTVAAVQGLQGAKAMTPAQISSLALEEPSGAEESDDEVSMISRGSSGSLAAGARAQPPAASSAPPGKREPVSKPGEHGSPESPEAEDAPGDQTPPAGRAASSAQPSSAAAASKGLPQEQRSSQAEHLQVLLEAPGIRPTAMCLIRYGDVDWLSFPQIHSVLLSNVCVRSLHSRLRSTKGVGPGNFFRATCKEREFLYAKGGCRGSRPGLVTFKAACDILQHCGAPASTVAAVQGLQGAKAMTPAEISALPAPSARDSAGNDAADEDGSEDEMPLLSRLGMKSPASPAVQRPDQAARSLARAPPKTPKVPKKARVPDATSAAKKGVKKAVALSPGQLLNRLPRPKAHATLNTSPRQRQLQLTFAPLRKAESAAGATPSTPEAQRAASGASPDAAFRLSRSARPSERAEWSHHSSDSEQHEAAADAPLQDDCAGAESQPTSSSFQLAIETLGKKTPCQPARVKPEDADHAAAATSAAAVRNHMAGVERLRQFLAAAPAASPPLSASVGAQQAKAALASKRSSSEALGACLKGLPGSKRLKISGSGELKTSAAGLERAKSPGRMAVTARKDTPNVPPRTPISAEATVDEDPVHVSAPARIISRAGKRRPPPFGMGADGMPPTPAVVEDAELVAEHEHLVENIYSRKVFEEYQRHWKAVVGKPWSQGMMPEYFLGRVNSSHKQRGDKVRDSVVDQVAQWLAFSPAEKRRYMDQHTKAVQLTDMRHPAFRRFKEVIEPWGLRKKEHALHFRKTVPEWTLLGEYCGVWDTQAPSSEAEDDDSSALDDPIGLGPLLRDKVSELGYTSKSAPADATNALRVEWRDALELEPTRAHNQLCLINDFRGVPGAPDLGNVAWLEMEDSRTLQPHLFIFTAVSVKAGQEALLDYGEEYHKTMEAPLRRAALLLATQPEAVAVHRALRAREQEALDKAVEVQTLQTVLRKEAAERLRLEKDAAEERLRLKAQAEQEQARAADMQEQLLQAQEAARRLEEELQAEKARAAPALMLAESESPGCLANGQALAVREAGQSHSKAAHEDEEAEETGHGCTCISGQAQKRKPIEIILARELVAAHAKRQKLQAELQEQSEALEKARAEAKRLGPELQELRATHQDTCKKSDAEIHRLSKVAKEFEWRLAELTKYVVPNGMTTDDLLAVGKTTPLMIVPVRRQLEQPSQLPEAPSQLPEQPPPLPEVPRPALLLLGPGPGHQAGESSSAVPETPGTVEDHASKERAMLPGNERSADAVRNKAKRSETDVHSHKERQHSRRDESDLHASRRRSPERHLSRERSRSRHHDSDRRRSSERRSSHERSRSRHHDSDRRHRASSGRSDRERSPARGRSRQHDSDSPHRAPSGRRDRERSPFRDRSHIKRGTDRRYRAPSNHKESNGVPDKAVRHSCSRPGQQAPHRLHKASPAVRPEDDVAAEGTPQRMDGIVPGVSVELEQAAAAMAKVTHQHLPPHLGFKPGASPRNGFSRADVEPHTDRAPYSSGLCFRGVPIVKKEDGAPQVSGVPLTR